MVPKASMGRGGGGGPLRPGAREQRQLLHRVVEESLLGGPRLMSLETTSEYTAPAYGLLGGHPPMGYWEVTRATLGVQ